MTITNITLPTGHAKSPSKATPLGKYLRQLRVTHPELPLLKDMADTLGYGSALLSGIELGKKAIPDPEHLITKLTEAYQIADNTELTQLINGSEIGAITECDRPVVNLNNYLQERIDSGKPMVIIEPNNATPELVELLKKMLPEDEQHKVTLVNITNQI
ncbi:HTH cro/C1-type domain-containing protein [Vibrio crassostreae]|nr:conserved hypothetical protein [Vibrio chagasii]CAK2873118.1 HTH cro/C1-type domain-containing protein [Vibrio crassostreae]